MSTISVDNLHSNTKGISSLIKLEWPYDNAGVGVSAKDAYENIDRCCPASNISQWDSFVRRHLQQVGNHFGLMMHLTVHRAHFIMSGIKKIQKHFGCT